MGEAKSSIENSMRRRLKAIQELNLGNHQIVEFDVDKVCQDSKSAESFRNSLKDCDDLKILYSLTLKSFGKLGSSQGLVKAFLERKGISDRSYARFNNPGDSNVIYVGSSASLRDRVKQHLGFGPKSTYALQLGDWLKGHEVTCTLEYFAVSTQEQRTLEDIEDGYWQLLRPLFGKKGGK